jgi:hypothetical protein
MIQVATLRRFQSFAIAAIVLSGALQASAQQYKSLPVDDRARLLGPLAQECAKNPSRYAVDKDRFTEYFQKYYFPAMTRPDPEALAELGRMRDDLLSRFLWASRDEKLQSDLTKIAFESMWPIATSKDYDPAVCYNAVLILGRLDKQYAIDSAANRRPPIPLEEATTKLNLIINSAAEGKAVPPYLLVGALVGLERHSQYTDGLGRDTVAGMNAAVLKLATKEVPLPEVDRDVVEWIRVQAATVLANLGKSQPTAEQLAAIDKMIADGTVPKMSLDARCRVAALLGTVKLDGSGLDGRATTDALLDLTISVVDSESKAAKAFQDANLQGGGYRGSMGRFGSSRDKGRIKFNPDTQEMELDNRLTLARLGDLKLGLSAAKSIAPADKQPVFDAVLAVFGPAIAAAESPNTVDLVVAGKIVAMADQVRSAVKTGSAPEAAAASGDVF